MECTTKPRTRRPEGHNNTSTTRLLLFFIGFLLFSCITACSLALPTSSQQKSTNYPITKDARHGYLFGLKLGDKLSPKSDTDVIYKDQSGPLFLFDAPLKPPEIDIISVITTPQRSSIYGIYGVIYSGLTDDNIVNTFTALSNSLIKKYTDPRIGKPCELPKCFGKPCAQPIFFGAGGGGNLTLQCAADTANNINTGSYYIITAEIAYDGMKIFNMRKRLSRDYKRLILVSLEAGWIIDNEIKSEEEQRAKAEEERRGLEKLRIREEQRKVDEKIQQMNLNPAHF